MKILVLIGCTVWLITATVAQTGPLKEKPGPASKQAVINAKTARDKLPENTLLWEISGKGLQKASYLFGTMHLLCAEDTKLSDNLKNIIKEAKLIYFEIDLDNLVEMMGALKYVRMNDNKKLSDILSEEEFKKVSNYFEKNPTILPLNIMESFKPYFISSLISEQKMTCENKGGMEQAIMGEAKQFRKEIKGLETVQFQASVFDSIPYQQQAKELVKYIDSMGTNTQVIEELVSVYKQQNLEKIEELTNKEEGGVAEFIDLLLYNRNADWVNKMQGIMQSDGVLFAVGAAHLPGEKGVINLLRQKGFTVKPLPNVMQAGVEL
ncbi:MAG: TraB/GumN family protein [Chitinophagaceae bacterium]